MGIPLFALSVPRRARSRAPTRTPHAAFSSALLLRRLLPLDGKIFSFTFLPFFPAHARRALIDAMGDAAAAAASTSAPDTPTSILICREDGSDLLADDADDGAAADLVVARDDRLLVVDPDEEYVALLLSEESASGGGGGAPAEEMEDWMKAARSGCVRWIIKVVRAGALPPSPNPVLFFFANVHLFFL